MGVTANQARLNKLKRLSQEGDTRRWCKDQGLPVPIFEWRFHPVRRWRFDVAWPDHHVALEIDGGIWTQGKHGRGAGILKDHEKQNAAAALGWRVLRTTPSTLRTPKLAAFLKSALNLEVK